MNGSPTSSVVSCAVLGRAAAALEQRGSGASWKTKATIEADDERADADEQPLAQLLEMLDERRLLAVAEATGRKRQSASACAR